METRERLVDLLTAVRYTTNDIEKVADEILALFSVGNSLKEPRHVCGAQGYDPMRGDVCEACKRERGQ